MLPCIGNGRSMMPTLTLRPIRALAYLNDHGPGYVHVCGLGCEATFHAATRPPAGPGYPREGVRLIENMGFTLRQLSALQTDILSTYPGLRDRTPRPLTEARVHEATDEGEAILRDPGIAVSVEYLPDAQCLEVGFRTETRRFNLAVFEELARTPSADLAEVELTSAGGGIYFPKLGIGLSALMLFRDRFERPAEQ